MTTLLELIDALIGAEIDATTELYATGEQDEIDRLGAEARRLRAEIERRYALAQADHSLMWRSHLDNNDNSRKRQRSLLRQAAANPGDRVRAKAAEHARNWRTDSPGGTK